MVSAGFDDYVTARAPALLRLAGVLAGDRGVAEDVVQEVLLRASRRWAAIGALDVPDAYVRRMVVNEYVSWRRKWGRLVPRAEITDGRPPNAPPPHSGRTTDMPTLDDLRSALLERESFAGDVHSVLATLDAPRRRDAATPRRRNVAPALAGAAVVVAAVGVAAVATGRGPHAEQAGQTQVSASSTPFSGSPAPATTAPSQRSTALTWGFSVAHVKGYSVRYSMYDPYGQSALITGPGNVQGSLVVHSPGAYDPADFADAGSTAGGQELFSAGGGQAHLAWQYAKDSWAELRLSNLPGPPTGANRTAARALVDRLAAAVRFGQSNRVAEPFALRTPGTRFLVEAVSLPYSSRACIGYGTGDAYPRRDVVPGIDLGTVLTVCRVDDGQTLLGIQNRGDRTYTRNLGDGTSLVLAVNVNHLDEVSRADLVQFAQNADTSPTLGDESTWLPVG